MYRLLPWRDAPPPPAWNIDMRHDGCIYSTHLHTLVLPLAWNSRNQDSSDQVIFFQFSSVQCFSSLGHCNRSFLFFFWKNWKYVRSPGVPYPIHVKVQRVVHSFMGLWAPMLYWIVSWLPVDLHNSCQRPLSSFINDPFSTTSLPLAGCPLCGGPFLMHTRNCWARKTQQHCSSWHTQTVVPGTYYHTPFKGT